jgi:hypothetical protein
MRVSSIRQPLAINICRQTTIAPVAVEALLHLVTQELQAVVQHVN